MKKTIFTLIITAIVCLIGVAQVITQNSVVQTFEGTSENMRGPRVFYSACPAYNGGYILAGQDYTSTNNMEDLYFYMIDEKGKRTSIIAISNTGKDKVSYIAQDGKGSYMVTGFSSSDVILAKINTLGQLQWQKSYGGGGFEQGYYFIPTSDGGYMIIGEKYNGVNVSIFLIKTDAEGEKEWSKTYYGDNGQDFPGKIIEVDGGYLFTCSHLEENGIYDGYIVKINTIGDTLWTKQVGAAYDDFIGDFVASPIGDGYYIIGKTEVRANGNISTSNYNSYITKVDLEGND